MKISAILLLIFLIGSCSSLKKESQEQHEIKNRASEYAAYGNQYYNQMEYGLALELFSIALNLNISIFNQQGMAENKLSIGKTLSASGSVSDGISYFYRALEIAEQSANQDLKARALIAIAESWVRLGDDEQFFNYLQKALQLVDSKELNALTRAIVYHNNAVYFRNRHNFAKATETLDMAIAINSRNGQMRELASNYFLKASILSLQEDYDVAIGQLLQTLELDRKTENSYGIAKALEALAIVHHKSGRNRESYDYYRRAFTVYNTLKVHEQLREIAGILYMMAAEFGTEYDQQYYKTAYMVLKGQLQ